MVFKQKNGWDGRGNGRSGRRVKKLHHSPFPPTGHFGQWPMPSTTTGAASGYPSSAGSSPLPSEAWVTDLPYPSTFFLLLFFPNFILPYDSLFSSSFFPLHPTSLDDRNPSSLTHFARAHLWSFSFHFLLPLPLFLSPSLSTSLPPSLLPHSLSPFALLARLDPPVPIGPSSSLPLPPFPPPLLPPPSLLLIPSHLGCPTGPNSGRRKESTFSQTKRMGQRDTAIYWFPSQEDDGREGEGRALWARTSNNLHFPSPLASIFSSPLFSLAKFGHRSIALQRSS